MDSLDVRLFFTVVLAVAPAVTMDEASSPSWYLWSERSKLRFVQGRTWRAFFALVCPSLSAALMVLVAVSAQPSSSRLTSAACSQAGLLPAPSKFMNAPRLAVTSPAFLLAMRLTCRCVSDSTVATPAALASRLLLIISCTLLCTLLNNSCAASPLVLGPSLLAAMFAVRLLSWLYPPAGVNGSRYRGDQPGDRRPTSARAPRVPTREAAAVYLYNCCNCFCSPVLAVLCFILNIWDVNARRAGSSLGQLGMTMVARQGAGRGTCLLVLVLLAGGANGSPIDPVPDDGSDLRWLAVAESLALLIGAEGVPLVARRVEHFLSQLRGHEGVLPSATPGFDMAWCGRRCRRPRLGRGFCSAARLVGF